MGTDSGLDRRAFLKGVQMVAIAGAAGAGMPVPAAATVSGGKYDFDTPYNRIGTDCVKWDQQIRLYGRDHIAVGMGVADMDFRVAPVITDALVKRVQHENWGYLDMPESFPELIIDWNKRRYGIDIHRDWLLMSTGVHPSIVSALRAFSPRDSRVLMMTPIYDGFYGDIAAAGCTPEESPMKLVNGRYAMDFEELERHISEETKTLILCNPHNPTGNCWSADDLTTVGEICTKRGIVLLVDEIHCDLVTKGNKYTPFSTLSNREIVRNSITFKSASKSFSLSAMKCGWMFSENPDYIAKIVEFGHSQDFNTIGMVATVAAYTRGEDWLQQVLSYLNDNHDYAASFIRANMPLVSYTKAQGTYLAWLDVTKVIEKIGARELAAQAGKGVTPEVLVSRFFIQNAEVQINPGSNYGRAGAGHMRMNLATSRQTLELALTNMATALNRISSDRS
jgi:cysteine-S-conjugate beta-lyase